MAANDVYFEQHVLFLFCAFFSGVCFCNIDNCAIDKKIFFHGCGFMLHYFKLMVVCDMFYCLP